MPTDEDIIRDLLHQYTDQVQPRASIATGVAARQRHRERRRRLASVAAAGAALGTAAGVIAVAPGHSSPPPAGPAGPSAAGRTQPKIILTAEQRALYQLSSVAAGQSQQHARYAVMSTEGTGLKDTSVIDSLTGDMWSYQQGTDGNPSGKGYSRDYSPTAAQFAAMPTSLAGLRAALITRWKNQTGAPAKPVKKTGRPTPVPLPVTESDNDMVFQEATYLLWNPLVSPTLRSALYRLLATVPGVHVSTSARDALGRRAVELSREDVSGRPGSKSDGQTYATYESPTTAAVLESTITDPAGSGVVTPQDPNGTSAVVDSTVYLSVSWASAVPGNPYGS
jgi:hypothetical protein